jgi:hypothetical protein
MSCQESFLSVAITLIFRITTAGIDSLLSPIAETPIVARLSATALRVTLRMFPNRSIFPL